MHYLCQCSDRQNNVKCCRLIFKIVSTLDSLVFTKTTLKYFGISEKLSYRSIPYCIYQSNDTLVTEKPYLMNQINCIHRYKRVRITCSWSMILLCNDHCCKVLFLQNENK